MGSAGGIILSERLKELEAALGEYYGALNELKMGLKPKKMPSKPQALLEYQRCKALGIPLVSGGVRDQPHVWLQELAVILNQEELWTKILEQRPDSNS